MNNFTCRLCRCIRLSFNRFHRFGRSFDKFSGLGFVLSDVAREIMALSCGRMVMKWLNCFYTRRSMVNYVDTSSPAINLMLTRCSAINRPAVNRVVGRSLGVVMAVAFVIVCGIRVNAYATDSNITIQDGATELYDVFVAEDNTAPRWCRWSLSVPGVSLDEAGGITLSGISTVDFTTDKIDVTSGIVSERQFIVIHGFGGLGDLWIKTGKYTTREGSAVLIDKPANLESVIIDKFPGEDGTAVNTMRSPKEFGKQQLVGEKDKYITFDTFNDNTNCASLCPTEAAVNASGNLVLNFNSGVGYVVYSGSSDGKLPMYGTKLPDGAKLEFYTDFALELFSGESNTAIVSGTADATVSTEYPAQIEQVDFDGTAGNITVRGLYGHAREMRAKCFNPYKNGTPTFEEAPMTLVLNDDGTVTLDQRWGAAGPVLNTSWKNMPLKVGGEESNVSPTATARNIWFLRKTADCTYFTDLLVAENDLGSVENTNDDMLKLHNRIENGEFEPITGTWSTYAAVDADIPNSHWNREDYSGPGKIAINFAPHHILPVKYVYTEFYEDLPERITYAIKTDEPKAVGTLRLSVPVDNLTVTGPTFELENYGNGDLGKGTCLYIAGSVAGVDDIFIVRGLLPDYSADEMSDAENGHRDGLLISDGRYDTAFVPTAAPDMNSEVIPSMNITDKESVCLEKSPVPEEGSHTEKVASVAKVRSMEGATTSEENPTEEGSILAERLAEGPAVADKRHNAKVAASPMVITSARSAGKTVHINVLVPNADIPGDKSMSNVFTLYGRTATPGGYRFDRLGVLDNITTDVADIAAPPATATYRIDGRTITALDTATFHSDLGTSTHSDGNAVLAHSDGDTAASGAAVNTAPALTISDITGRTIATLAPGQSVTLTPGHYLIIPTPNRAILTPTRSAAHILIR